MITKIKCHCHLQITLPVILLLFFILEAATVSSFQLTNNNSIGIVRNVVFKLSAAADADEADDDEEWRKQIDGGGDLTDRFKHKVHALMGTYDPPQGTTDDENQMGYITGALLQFPTDYTFSVVGRTTDGDSYAGDVKSLMGSILGSDARMETRVVPRGSKFTRVSVKVSVESPAIIASIYEELDAMELTVMKF